MAANKVNVDLVRQAHIPMSLRDPVLEMTSAHAYTGCLPTVFVGIVDNDYPEEMWNAHATRIAKLFNVSQDTGLQEIKIRSISKNLIDGEQLGREIDSAINFINSQSIKDGKIRIVGMGIHSAIAVHEALASLVRGWDLPWADKRVQFVALGDSSESDYLNLCKRMCLKKLCGGIQFYMTMDYNNVGFLDLDSRNLQRMNPEALAKLLADSNVTAGDSEKSQNREKRSREQN